MNLIAYFHPASTFDSFSDDPVNALSPLFEIGRNPEPKHHLEWFEDETNYYARLDLPGISKDELHPVFEDNVVTFSVSRSNSGTEEFLRETKLRIPYEVLPDKSEATLQDGILTLKLPKVPESGPLTIKIS